MGAVSVAGAWLKANAVDYLRDGAGLAGAALIAFGAGKIYEPAGFIVAGLFLVAFAVLTGATPKKPAA
ncbi:MAG: hypothetical protein KA105_02750 [Caulobacter sp.]|nr:hypothetical protein [Caulobacter sp.]